MALGETKGKRDKLSAFGQWMDDKAVTQGTSLQEIARYLGLEYALIARFSAGTKDPTYEMAQQIGEMVDDAAGALAAAGFTPPSPAPKAPAPPASGSAVRRTLASGDEIIVAPGDTDPDDTVRRVEAFLIALRKERTGRG